MLEVLEACLQLFAAFLPVGQGGQSNSGAFAGAAPDCFNPIRYSTVLSSEPAPACDPVRGQNDAGYTGPSNSWNLTPSPAQSSVIDLPMVSMNSLKMGG